MSPPIVLHAFKGHTAYYISKFGMTMVALGVAAEFEGTGITANSLWPATIIESFASINFKMGDRPLWRKASILSDSVLSIISEPDTFTGNMLIDDSYLRTKGLKNEDFVLYRCVPDSEPPHLLDFTNPITITTPPAMKRGDVRKLDKDSKASL